MANPVIARCPICAEALSVARLECVSCGTRIEGSFALGRFHQLSAEQLDFLETFIKARGNFKDVERELGISYPTVRSRLDAVIRAVVGLDDDESESHDQTIEKTFTVEGMPRLRVQNISGETAIRVGEPGQVRIVARKRVKGGSADRAKRLLENVEVRIEQQGNDIFVEPHLYEQERSWVDLFRGKRFRVDFEITVPRETAVNAQTASGDLDPNGTRGPARVESVPGDVNIAHVQGPMRIKSVSGDVQCTDYVGAVEGSSVSGDVDIRGRVRAW